MNRKNPNIAFKKERRLKKTCIRAASAMLLFGLLVGGVGLLQGRNHPEALAETGDHSWYRTFSITEDGWWVGLDFSRDGSFNVIRFAP